MEQEHKNKNLSFFSQYLPGNDCSCSVRCNGVCKNSMNSLDFSHPLLSKGIKNIPFVLVSDLVCVLESVRCINLQYNVFDWKNIVDLGDYINSRSIGQNGLKNWCSDTEAASDASNRSGPEDVESVSEANGLNLMSKVNSDSFCSSVKRKTNSEEPGEIFSLDIGANIEVESDDSGNKKIKVEHSFGQYDGKTVQSGDELHMQDAIENVIRMSLTDRVLKPFSGNPPCHEKVLDQSVDGVNHFLNSQCSNSHTIYPYSLTSVGKQENLISNPKMQMVNSRNSIQSSVESKSNYIERYDKNLNCIIPTNFIKRNNFRESVVISPNICSEESNSQRQETPSVTQYSFHGSVVKTGSSPICQPAKGIDSRPSVSPHAKEIAYEHGALNLSSNNNYGKSNNVEKYPNPDILSSYQSQLSSRMVDTKQGNSVVSESFNVSNSRYFETSSHTHNAASSKKAISQVKAYFIQQPVNYSNNLQDSLSTSTYTKPHTAFQESDANSTQTSVRQTGSMSVSSTNEIPQTDRNSVIQHTVQQAVEKTVQIRSHLSVSVNSSAVQHIRNISYKDGSSLPPLRVNVADKNISKSNLAVPASLVIARKPYTYPVSSSSQPTTSTTSSSLHCKDTITIPGILASPSVIMTSGWETNHQKHGNMPYKKNKVSAASIVKKVYRKPYERQSIQNEKCEGIGGSTCKIVPFIQPTTSHIQPITSKQKNFIVTNQGWPVSENKVKSTTVECDRESSSQPWYSVPYPKSPNPDLTNASSFDTHINKNRNSPSSFTSAQQSEKASKSIMKDNTSLNAHLYVKDNHLEDRNSPAAVNHNHLLINKFTSVSHPSAVSPDSSNQAFKQMKNIYAIPKKQFINKKKSEISDFSSVHLPSSVTTSSNLYSAPQCGKTMINSSHGSPISFSSASAQDTKLSIAYSKSDTYDITSQYSQSKNNSDIFTKVCCSPKETNPCQSCSVTSKANVPYTESMHVQKNESAQRTSTSVNSNMFLSSSDVEKHRNAEETKSSVFSINNTQRVCQFCSISCPSSMFKWHIINFHKTELLKENKHGHSKEQISLDFSSSPNMLYMSNSLPGNHEGTLNDLRQNNDGPSVNKTDFKFKENEEINDDNMFTMCMNLINSEKEFSKLVQNVDCLEQIDNCSLPFIPDANDDSYSFPNPQNFTDVVKREVVPQYILQNLPVCGEDSILENITPNSDQFNNESFEKSDEVASAYKDFDRILGFFADNQKLEKPVLEECSFDKSVTVEGNASASHAGDLHPFIPNSLSKSSTFITLTDVKKNVVTTIQQPSLVSTSESNSLHLIASSENNLGLPFQSSYVTDSDKNYSECDNIPSSVSEGNVLDLHVSLAVKSIMAANQGKEAKAEPSFSNNKGNISLTEGKSSLKKPTKKCEYCKKTLTAVYIKKHILKMHSEKLPTAGATSLNSVSGKSNKSLIAQGFRHTYPLLTAVLEQNADTSTCLSVSDALKTDEAFAVDQESVNDKFIEDPHLKFDFNVPSSLAKDDKHVSHLKGNTASKLKPSELAILMQHHTTPPDNFKLKDPNSSEKPRCCVCFRKYTSLSTLNRHMKAVHFNEYTGKGIPKVSKPSEILEGSIVQGESVVNLNKSEQDLFPLIPLQNSSSVAVYESSNTEQIAIQKTPFKQSIFPLSKMLPNISQQNDSANEHKLSASDSLPVIEDSVSKHGANAEISVGIMKPEKEKRIIHDEPENDYQSTVDFMDINNENYQNFSEVVNSSLKFSPKFNNEKESMHLEQVSNPYQINANQNICQSNIQQISDYLPVKDECTYSGCFRDCDKTEFPELNNKMDCNLHGLKASVSSFKDMNLTCASTNLSEQISQNECKDIPSVFVQTTCNELSNVQKETTLSCEDVSYDKQEMLPSQSVKENHSEFNVKHVSSTNSCADEITPVSKCLFAPNSLSNDDHKTCEEENSLKLLISDKSVNSASKSNEVFEENSLSSADYEEPSSKHVYDENSLKLVNEREDECFAHSKSFKNSDTVPVIEGNGSVKNSEKHIKRENSKDENYSNIHKEFFYSVIQASTTTENDNFELVHKTSATNESNSELYMSSVEQRKHTSLLKRTFFESSVESDNAHRKRTFAAKLRSKNRSKECRLCHEKLSSMEALSMHLKHMHSIPVLKKQKSFSEERASIKNTDKLSPPNLLYSNCDSDSNSVSLDSIYPHAALVNSCSDNGSTDEKNMHVSDKDPLYEYATLKSSNNCEIDVEKTFNQNNTDFSHFEILHSSLYSKKFGEEGLGCRIRRHSFSDIKTCQKLYTSEVNLKYLFSPMDLKCKIKEDSVSKETNYQNSKDNYKSCTTYSFSSGDNTSHQYDSLSNIHSEQYNIPNSLEKNCVCKKKIEDVETSFKNISSNLKSSEKLSVSAPLQTEELESGCIKNVNCFPYRRHSFSSSSNTTFFFPSLACSEVYGRNKTVQKSHTSDNLNKNKRETFLQCENAPSNQVYCSTSSKIFSKSDFKSCVKISRAINSSASRRRRILRKFNYRKKSRQRNNSLVLENKIRKCNNSFILTFKKSADITKFLKTHKQPFVRLTRLSNADILKITIQEKCCNQESSEDSLNSALGRLEKIDGEKVDSFLMIHPKSESQIDENDISNLSNNCKMDSSSVFCSDISTSCLSNAESVPVSESFEVEKEINVSVAIQELHNFPLKNDCQEVQQNEKCSIRNSPNELKSDCLNLLNRQCYVLLKRV
ncbi:hypothetical protein X975_07622, partial [Stegodyphus mimosarum]